jgi:hypothetical protein
MVAITNSRRAAHRRASDLLAEKTMICNEFLNQQQSHSPSSEEDSAIAVAELSRKALRKADSTTFC